MRERRRVYSRALMRRPVLLLSLFLLLPLSRPGSAEDWPTFLGPRQDARSAETGLLLDWPEQGPPILWTLRVGEGYSMPSIAGGVLLHFDRVGDEARLSAHDALTGELRWRQSYPSTYVDAFEFSGGPRASPVIDGELVFAFGVDGVLRCHRLSDGAVVWERRTGEEYGVVTNFFGVGSTPLVVGELLIVPVGGSPPAPPRGWDIHQGEVPANGSGIVAFDKRTGEERWKGIDDLASYSSPVLRRSPAGEPEVAWFGRERLWLFAPGDGRVRASFPWRAEKIYSVNAATPVLSGNEIFLSESYQKGGVLLRDAVGDGGAQRLEVVWADPPRRGQAMANHWNTAVLDDGTLYGSSGEKSGSAELRAVDWATGEVLWSRRGLRRSTATWVEGHLVVLGEYGELVLIEATRQAYREKARLELRSAAGERLLRHPAWSPPAISQGVLYVAGDRQLVALDLRPPRQAPTAR
ncbi:MAG: hypothetical protein DWQ30_15870 [Acidobacteria bacterium]|nr:MAG: hypothetical protein DWQ30_15870 [Acidobacteriota bacterium]